MYKLQRKGDSEALLSECPMIARKEGVRLNSVHLTLKADWVASPRVFRSLDSWIYVAIQEPMLQSKARNIALGSLFIFVDPDSSRLKACCNSSKKQLLCSQKCRGPRAPRMIRVACYKLVQWTSVNFSEPVNSMLRSEAQSKPKGFLWWESLESPKRDCSQPKKQLV